jgi:hypothetical protein
MSTPNLLKIIKRLDTVTQPGKFAAVISDAMKAFFLGEITAKEAEMVNRASGKKLRKWNAELKAEEAKFRAEMREKAGLAARHRK